MPGDATLLTVPLWGAITTAAGVFSVILGVVAWVFTNFERKTDAIERTESIWRRHYALEEQVKAQNTMLSQVAQDVSYIRGRLEPKD